MSSPWQHWGRKLCSELKRCCKRQNIWKCFFVFFVYVSQWNTYNEKTCPDHDSLHPHIQVHRKLDTKVVRICEHFPKEASPLLADFPNLADLIHGQNLKEDAKFVFVAYETMAGFPFNSRLSAHWPNDLSFGAHTDSEGKNRLVIFTVQLLRTLYKWPWIPVQQNQLWAPEESLSTSRNAHERTPDNLIAVFGSTNLKVHIWKATPSAKGTVDLQDRLRVFIGDDEFRGEGVPLLHDVPHRVSRGGLHLQLKKTTFFKSHKFDSEVKWYFADYIYFDLVTVQKRINQNYI